MTDLGAEIFMISAALATYSLWPYRSVAAMTLAVFNVTHFVMFEHVDSDVVFYVSALTFDVACALALLRLGTRLSVDMAVLSLCNAAANLAGLIIWFAYFPAFVYNAGMTTIMGLQIMRLLWVKPDDMAGCAGIRGWHGLGSGNHLWRNRSAEGEKA